MTGSLEKLFDLRDRIGAWCAALAMVGLAFFVWYAPDEIRDEILREIPDADRWAIAPLIFGGVFLAALMLPGRAGRRAKNLTLSLLFAALTAAAGWYAYAEASTVLALHEHGIQKRLEVRSSVRKSLVKNAGWKMSFRDGRRTILLTQPKRIAVGTRVNLRYLPGDAASTTVVPPGADLLDLASARGVLWGIALAALLGVAFALATLAFAWATLVGAAAPDEAQAGPGSEARGSKGSG